MDQRCDLFPRLIDRRFTIPTEDMIATRSIAELLCEEWQHRFHHPGINLGGGVIVHVNRQFHTKLPGENQVIPLDWSDLKITNLVLPVNEGFRKYVDNGSTKGTPKVNRLAPLPSSGRCATRLPPQPLPASLAR
jgi:hypothetical protein